jgi:ubiquinone/menaquinone biosynthesis C-methylase UbiE
MAAMPPAAAPAHGGEVADALKFQTRLLWPREREVLLPLVAQAAGECSSLLDVCCGTGEFLARLAEELPGCELFGADHNALGLSHTARLLGDRARLLQCDATSMPYEDNRFDVVTCRHALQTMPPDVAEAVVREMVRVCRPGGLIYLTNEDVGSCWGSLRPEAIDAGMRVFCRLWTSHGMDIRFGLRQDRLLRACGLGTQVTPIIARSCDGPEDWERMVLSWKDIHERMAYDAGINEQEVGTLLHGLELYKRCATEGHAEWPVWACWALKQ